MSRSCAMRHFEDTFLAPDGVRLYRQGWVPDQTRAVVCFIHGAFEHSGRFRDACSFIGQAGFAVHTIDLRGHGKSQGEIGPDTPFFTLLDDINAFIDSLKKENAGPLFLLGQSLGGSLALMAACSGHDLSGLILCAPACRTVMPPTSIIAAYALGKVLPNFQFKALESHLIARDPVVAQAYEKDPLVNRQGIPMRPFTEFMRTMRARQGEFEKMDLPLLIFHGTEDKIVDIRGSQQLYLRSVSRDKSFEVLPHFYHDLLNDPGRHQIFGRIVSWIGSRLQ